MPCGGLGEALSLVPAEALGGPGDLWPWGQVTMPTLARWLPKGALEPSRQGVELRVPAAVGLAGATGNQVSCVFGLQV